MAELKAPFVYFGGKGTVAAEVWQRFGLPDTYVEPFCGSAAVLLGSPHWPHSRVVETINDASGWIVNVWRAIQADPEEVARWADAPVFEPDLHAKHAWLMGQRSQLVERLEGDPDYFDAKVAGWWVWGASCWIGHGWCSGNGPWSVEEDEEGYRVLTKNGAEAGAWRKRPQLTSGQGIAVSRKLPDLTSAGRGALSRQVPYLSSAGQCVNRQMTEMHSARGVVKSSMADDRTAGLVAWMQDLSARLRDVRILCGDWKRAVTPAVTTYHGIAAVLLDPPYNDDERTPDLYTEDSGTVAAEVRQWCIENGDNPSLRIALCGYAGEHDELDDAGWERFEWKANGGYGNQGKKTSRGRDNATREVIWFNKSCVKPDAVQGSLF